MTHSRFAYATIALLAALFSVASLTTAVSIKYVAPGGNDSTSCQSPVSPCAPINPLNNNAVGANHTLVIVDSPVASVAISGPLTGLTQTAYEFTASASPITATLPITYLWSATEQSPVTHTGDSLIDSIAFTWTTIGTKTVTVTAINVDSAVAATHLIVLGERPNIYLPMIARNACTGPLYADDFSNPASGWPVSDSSHVHREYLDGEYSILIKNTNYWAGSHPQVKFSDYAASVDVHMVSGTDAWYGIIFGLSDDWTQFYTFEIHPDGYYSLYRYDSGAWTTLTKNFSAAINQGISLNNLTVIRSGSQIAVYANGQFLFSTADGTYVGARYPGVIVTAYRPNTDVRFDNFKVYPVDCQPASTAPQLFHSSRAVIP